jgi:hypothetical protein
MIRPRKSSTPCIREDAEMWRNLKAFLKVKDFSEVSWPAIYKAKRELGYPLERYEIERLGAS